jgi:ribosomal protein L33
MMARRGTPGKQVPLDTPEQTKPKKKGRAPKNINSSFSSVIGSPNKFQPLSTNDDEPVVTLNCNICKNDNPKDISLECQRCKDHFCITCLNKSKEECKLLNESDLMWFCPPCREKVEKNIVTDRKIEETCKEMMQAFNLRILGLETAMEKKCDKSDIGPTVRSELDKCLANSEICAKTDVSKIVQTAIESKCDKSDIGPIVRSELDKCLANSEICDKTDVSKIVQTEVKQMSKSTNQNTTTETPKGPELNELVGELNERKLRENNLIVYGVNETITTERTTRQEHDMERARKITQICDKNLGNEDVVKIIRLGKFEKTNPTRPLLVSLKSADMKAKIFKGAKSLIENEEYKNVKLANDLTKTERETEKQLYARARELTEKESSGEFMFKVRGPPWARKVVKIKGPRVLQPHDNP